MSTNNKMEDICLDCQLIQAIQKFDNEEAMELIEGGASIDPCDHFTTPLIVAVEYSNIEMVEFLLGYDVDVHALDEDGLQAIDYASDGYIVSLLIDAGSNPSFKAGRLSLSEFAQVLQIYQEQGQI